MIAAEPQHRRGRGGQVDRQGDQVGVLGVAGAELVAVDDGEPAGPAGQVAQAPGSLKTQPPLSVRLRTDQPSGVVVPSKLWVSTRALRLPV